jgi:hypothetical protein
VYHTVGTYRGWCSAEFKVITDLFTTRWKRTELDVVPNLHCRGRQVAIITCSIFSPVSEIKWRRWRWRSRRGTVWNTFVFSQTKKMFHDCERTVSVPICKSALTEPHISNFDNTCIWVVVFCAFTALKTGKFHRRPSGSKHLDTGASPVWSQRIHSLG